MLNRKLLFFVITFISLLISSCGSTSTKVVQPQPTQLPHSNIVIKYYVRSFEMDLTQESYKVGQEFPERTQLETQLKSDFMQKLAASNLLATKDDINVIDLEIFVDYRRRFVGDATPFPINNLAPPNVRITEKALLGNIVLREDNSGNLTNQKLVFSTDREKSKEQELENIVAIANTLMKRLIERRQTDTNIFAQKISGLDIASVKEKRIYTEESILLPAVLSSRTGLSSPVYLPSELSENYIKRIQSSNSKERLSAYKDLAIAWINTPDLYTVIKEYLNQNINSTDKAVVNEMTEAMKAISSSGLTQNIEVLRKIQQDAASEDLKKYATKALTHLQEREELASIVHNTQKMSPELDWKSNQLLNMLMSDNAPARSLAIKEIYRTQLSNTPLLDAVSYQLETSSIINRFRNWEYTDTYAWSCRVLGSSGNKAYKPVLDKVETQAFNSKVRDYAKKFAKELK